MLHITFFLYKPDSSVKVKPSGGELRFSFITAWSRSGGLEELISEKFPSLEFLWHATDEFGNFHFAHDPEDRARFDWFHLSDGNERSDYYGKGEGERFLADLRAMLDELDVPDGIVSDEGAYDAFVKKFCEWRDADYDGRWMFEFSVYFPD